MADLIGAVTKVTSNFLEINQVSIDNWGFKLFYKATTVYLILSSVLTTAKYAVKYLYVVAKITQEICIRSCISIYLIEVKGQRDIISLTQI